MRRERNCSVARTLDIVSDAWAFLIIREAFFGWMQLRANAAAGNLLGLESKVKECEVVQTNDVLTGQRGLARLIDLQITAKSFGGR